MLKMLPIIAMCAFGVVRSDNDYLSSLSQLGFGGEGSKTCDDDGNCASAFSSGFRSELCSFAEYNSGSTSCWGITGISVYGDFITRALYEQESDSDSNDGAGQYIATSVILKSDTDSTDVEYSNILILPPNDRKCDAGDMVLTKHNDVFYFLFACTDYILVFNETAIAEYPSGISVNDKKFYYRVYPEDVIEIEGSGIIDGTAYDLSLSFISRNQNTRKQFWTGRFSEDSSDPLIKLVTFDFDSMSITAVDAYAVDSAFTFTGVQGITRIGENMLIAYNVDEDDALSRLTLCPMSTRVVSGTRTRVVSGTGCVSKCTVNTHQMVGAEVSSDGTVYVGSEFGSPRGIWYDFEDFSTLDGAECYNWDAAPPLSALPDIDVHAPILPRMWLSSLSSVSWLFVGVGMSLIFLTMYYRQTVNKTDSWEYSAV